MSTGVGPVLLDVAIIVLAAKFAGELFERMRQPAVVGELLAGIILSPALLGARLGLPDLALDAADEATVVMVALAGIGAILLLFEVGLESDIRQMGRVGASSMLVAFIGVAVSFAAGYGLSAFMASLWEPWQAANTALPPHLLHIFMGAALTATSVGITARVLADLQLLRTAEARIILGAAVLDDVVGLIVLAVVAALIQGSSSGGSLAPLDVFWIVAKAVLFLVVALVVGLRFVPRAYDALVPRMRVAGFPVALAFGFCLLMAFAASAAGLADIVGAFAGGLLLAQTRHAHKLFESVKPLGAILIGFFFVTIGMRVDVDAMLANGLIVVLGGLAFAAVGTAAKLACGWGVLHRQAHRLPVGVGMVPRGEVGLIFAGLGLATGLLGPVLYAAVVLGMLVTTVITPIWLMRIRNQFTPDLAPTGERENLARALEP